MSFKFLEHATDAIVEVEAPTMVEALGEAANAVIHTTLNPEMVRPTESREIHAEGGDLRHMLFSWLEEVIYLLITKGFAIKEIKPHMSTRGDLYVITGRASGERMDLSRHGFKVEIKAPTFHEMEIQQQAGNGVRMRFLLDL